MKWLDDDLEDLERRGIPREEAERQIDQLRQPRDRVDLVRPATAGDGILVIPDPETGELVTRAGEAAEKGRVRKFVPASGAASRMFAELMPALDPGRTSSSTASRFFSHFDEFPFAGRLRELASDRGVPVEARMSDEDKRVVLELLLTSKGLDYASVAKGLILFHRYPDEVRTAFEEQLREGIMYTSDGEAARFHFTVPQRDLGRFSTEGTRVSSAIREQNGIRCNVELSVQHPSTDTIAITPEGEPFRTENGRLLFRPGGHGALLRNLGELEGDIVFIKNIDNVRPRQVQRDVSRWYQVLIGQLVALEERVRNAVRAMEADGSSAVVRAAGLAAELFARPWHGDRDDLEAMKQFVLDALLRPIRVCAVVRNEGEPGGAPFWVRGAGGDESLQIVESSQIDMDDSKQRKVFGSSTHFNPVAIACALRNPDGVPYDLRRFVDPDAAFVSQKTHQGKGLRALEHPGLWNGAMAGWNSVFVEVPAFTFAPVKTVFDLLRAEHRTDDGI